MASTSVSTPKNTGAPRTTLIRSYFAYNGQTRNSSCQIEGCYLTLMGDNIRHLERHLQCEHADVYTAICKKANSRLLQLRRTQRHQQPKPVKVNTTMERVKEACIELMTTNGQPFDIVDDSGFRRILNPLLNVANLDSSAISSAMMQEMVVSKAAAVRASIRDDLRDKLLSVKVDILTHDDRGFLSINVYYIEDGKHHERTLKVTRLPLQYTNVYLKRLIEKVLEDYEIDISKIYSFTIDDASDTQIDYGKLLSTNLVPAFNEDEDTEEDDSDDDDEINISQDEASMEQEDTSEDCCLSNDTTVIPNTPPVSHSLHRAIEDALMNIPNAMETIGKARKVVKSLATSLVSEALIAAKPEIRVPELDAVNCWTSTVGMLKSLLEVKEFCIEFSSTHKTLELTNSEWEFIEDYVDSLSPAKFLVRLLREQELTLGFFYSLWIDCKLVTSEINAPLAVEIVKAMEKREVELLENEALLASLYLDPRFNVLLPDQYHSAALSKLEKVWIKINEFSNLRSIFFHSNSPNGPNSVEISDICRKKLEEIAAPQIARALTVSTVRRHLQQFMTSEVIEPDASLLGYWEGRNDWRPQLWKLATIVHAAPASHVGFKRLLPEVSYILSTGSHLKARVLDDILLIRCNNESIKKLQAKVEEPRVKRRRVRSHTE